MSAASGTDFVCWNFLTPYKPIRCHFFLLRRFNFVVRANSTLVHDENGVQPKNDPSLTSVDKKDRVFASKLYFLEERDEEILSKRLINLGKNNKVKSAMELFASMHAFGLKPSSHACNSFIACLIRSYLINDALEVFHIARKLEIATCHTYSLVLKAIANVQGCDSAIELFDVLRCEDASKKNFDVIVYNTMIAVCGKAKRWAEVEKLWKEMEESKSSGSMLTYDLLVSIFVQCGQTELALESYYEMIDKGLDPSEDIMKAIIACCTKEGHWRVASNVFEEMISKGMKPNLIAYNAVINSLGKAGEDELAFKIYDSMKLSGHKPDSYTWSALLSSLYRSNHYSDVIQLFENIRTNDSSQLNEHVYSTILMACQKLGLWERSVQILWEMENSGMEMSTISYNHVIYACEAAKKPKVALQVYQHMIQKKCAPDTFTYLSLIRACTWGSLWNDAEEILQCVEPDASLYNALILGFCLRGKISLAKKLYIKMRNTGLTPNGKTRALMLQHLSDNLRRHPRARCVQRQKWS